MTTPQTDQREVLIVDDDPSLRPLLSRALEDEGRTLTFVGTVAGATALASGDILFDLAVVDKRLPDGSGLDLTRKLKELQPHIEVVLVTGYGSLDSALEAMDAGAFDYVLKPFDSIQTLAHKVQKGIEQARLKRDKEALLNRVAESERRYRSLFEGSTDGILVVDEETATITDANPAAIALYGYDAEELRAMKLDQLRAAAPTGTIRRERPHRIWHRRKDGTRVPVDTTRAELTLDGHRYLVYTVRDVTERIDAESERTELEEQVQQARKMEALGRLAGGVAHDFNNLLVIILSNIDGLLEDLELTSEPRARLNEVLATAKRAAGLTKQLLTFSRQKVVEPQILDTNRVIAGLLPLLRPLLGETISVTTQLDPNLWHVRLDEDQLGQVLFNLAVNARDAMGGRGELFVETENVDFEDVHASRQAGVDPGPYVCLSVSDAGAGIDPGVADMIFEPFFTTKEDESGGLGLAVVYGIVQQAGGNVKVYSELGVGTTLKVYLPAHDSMAPPPRRPVERIGTERRSESVLLVEDEHGVRSVIARMLHKHGFRVLEASDGQEAVEILERADSPVDLVVTDIVMPHLSGDLLVEEIDRLCPTAKVLMMSGYTRDLVLKQGLARRNTAYIQKPFTPARFLERVVSLLEGGE